MIGPFDQTSFASSELDLQINCTGFTDSELDPLSRVDSVPTVFETHRLPQFYHSDAEGRGKCTRDVLATRFSNREEKYFKSVGTAPRCRAREDWDWFTTRLPHFLWDSASSSAVP